MEKEEGLSKLPASPAGDHWCLLPELALHSIAMRLRSPACFIALCGVCQDWRSVVSSASITSDFISSIPPLILLFPRSTSTAAASIYSLADDAIYDFPSIPSFRAIAFFGQSNGYLLGLDDSTVSIPSITNPVSGICVNFPSLVNPIFSFAIFTVPPTSPEPQLVLFRSPFIMFCPIRGTQWTSHSFPVFRDAIFFQDRLYLTHRSDQNVLRVRVVEYDLQTNGKRQIFDGRRGLLVESSEGELLMVFKEQEMLVGFKLLPMTETGLADNGETDWPGGGERILFLGWQRSDLWSSCHTGSIRRKYRTHSSSPFWRNYLASSKLRSNGFYVPVDARGRAEVSRILPGWRQLQHVL